MTIKAKNVPVRILKVWFDICLALGGLACLVFLVWLAVSPFLMSGGEIPVDATVQVAVGERSLLPVLALELDPHESSQELGIQTTRLVKGRGELRFLTTSWWLHFLTLGEIMLGTVIILYVTWTLRMVLIKVLADRPFDAANGQGLRRCGYIVLITAVIYPILDFALASSVLSRIDITNIDLRPAITLSFDALIVGLLFLVFGMILTRAHELHEREQELEQEQALTI